MLEGGSFEEFSRSCAYDNLVTVTKLIDNKVDDGVISLH